jgi:hypothetical protein
MAEVENSAAPLSIRSSRFLLSGTTIVVFVALVRIVLYFFCAPHYGYFRDELYYLACGMHPAWGYVDQPPFIAWIAWLLEHSIGTSLWALRLLPALAGAGAIILAGLLSRELGGRRWAMFLAALATLAAPIVLIFSHLFTMNAFDPLLWTAIACLIVRIVKTGRERLWILVGILSGITILNKYGVVFWFAGLIAGMLFTPLRASFRRSWFWIGATLGALLALPNFFWQWSHQFPFLQLMHNIRMEGRDVSLPPLPFLEAQAEMLGYAAAILVLFALLFFFSKVGRPYRAFGWAYLIFVGIMMALHGKMYYLTAVYPMMFAAGAVWVEGATSRKRWNWAKPALALAIIAISGIYLPMSLPVLSVQSFLAYEHKLGIQAQRFEHNRPAVLPQIYADMFGWSEMADRVAAFYHTLSPQEQRETAIFANDYGEGGAIDFFGQRYGLPEAIGGHQNFWIWGPRNYTGTSLIVLGESDVRNMQRYCASYSVVGTTQFPLSRPDEWEPIYYCRGFKWNLQTIWPQLKRWQ